MTPYDRTQRELITSTIAQVSLRSEQHWESTRNLDSEGHLPHGQLKTSQCNNRIGMTTYANAFAIQSPTSAEASKFPLRTWMPFTLNEYFMNSLGNGMHMQLFVYALDITPDGIDAQTHLIGCHFIAQST